MKGSVTASIHGGSTHASHGGSAKASHGGSAHASHAHASHATHTHASHAHTSHAHTSHAHGTTVDTARHPGTCSGTPTTDERIHGAVKISDLAVFDGNDLQRIVQFGFNIDFLDDIEHLTDIDGIIMQNEDLRRINGDHAIGIGTHGTQDFSDLRRG